MKVIFFIIIIYSFLYSADSLEKVYARYKAAEEIAVYKKADAAMLVLSKESFDNQYQKGDSVYVDYADYVKKKTEGINITKTAIKTKLSELKSVIAADSVYTASEKAQYSGEIDVRNSKVVPLTTTSIKDAK
jgi:hypothetical protein